jgi:hypothetical protein
MVGQLAAAGLSAYGSEQAGAAQQSVDNANARIEGNNATAAELAAKSNAAQIERNVSRTTGQVTAGASASGVQAGTGTPIAVMHDVATEGALARRLTIFKGQQEAKGLFGQASIDVAQGKAAYQAGLYQAGSTLMTAGNQAAQQAAEAGMMG